MKASRYPITTLKETPAEAEVASHQLMLRAGLIRKVAAGVYTFLPLGRRVLARVEAIVREEMNRFGAIEILMPALQPRELWEESGRWAAYGPEMMRVKDRKGRDFALGPTHEELITRLVDGEIRSYRELPLNFYQIQPKFRDEPRPRFGVIRAREFIMKDAYSFDRDQEGLAKSYELMRKAYVNIFTRCGLDFRVVSAATGLIGGKVSEEFMALADIGEDTVFHCEACGYAANRDLATGRASYSFSDADSDLETIDTPGMRTIDELTGFLGIAPSSVAKTMLYRTENGYLAAVLPGDREVVEAKLQVASGATSIELLAPEDIEALGIPFGFAGPVGLKDRVPDIVVLVDERLANARGLVVGANERDRHLGGVSIARDVAYDAIVDIAEALPGDACPSCGSALKAEQAIEVGHIFQLGTRYSDAMKAYFSDEDGQLKPFVMGCYGIGVSRIIAAVIEQHHDGAGIIWPVTLAPFDVAVLLIAGDAAEATALAERLHNDLSAAGLEVLLDDREESAGVKFADADLIGFPYQVIVGKTFLKTGQVEIKERSTGERFSCNPRDVPSAIGERLAAATKDLSAPFSA